jgi:tetratricopeptide (TPR) repeat protein
MKLRSGFFRRILLTAAVFILAQTWLGAADTNLAVAVPARTDETNSQEILKVYLQLQEQLHEAQLAIEQSRKESKEAAAQNAEALSQRLHAIEQALATQRARELEAMQSSNRVMLIVAGSFACVGFLVMIVGAYFQWRTAQSLTSLSGMAPVGRVLGPSPTFPALGPGEGQVLSIGSTEQSNLRLLGALEQLEKRINELEHTSRAPLKEGTPAGEGARSEAGKYGGENQALQSNGGSGGSFSETGEAEQVEMLLGKGISMLNLDQMEPAIECFDKVLGIDPQNAEALVRKGIALERMQMLNEAVQCYDRAISIDGSLTIAYLHKGGLYNRMERYDEALACYEKALRTQESRDS